MSQVAVTLTTAAVNNAVSVELLTDATVILVFSSRQMAVTVLVNL